jgi:phosphoribosylformylglycinamidine synthase
MRDVKVLVLTGYGLNCDYETAYAFELAGASAERVHINSIIDAPARLDHFHILVFIGGFSWGDDHGAGVVQAIRFKTKLGRKLIEFAGAGKLILGICNGFQSLVNLGLLPGFDGDYKTRSVALTFNDCGNFRDDWIHLAVNPASPCIFTNGLDRLELPVRHGEGKFYSDKATIGRLFEQNLIALQYAFPDGRPADRTFPVNPNGSEKDIAGICDPTGRIFGLMPHPEAFNHFTNHPNWTRIKEKMKRKSQGIATGPTAGIRMLQNGVDYIRNG